MGTKIFGQRLLFNGLEAQFLHAVTVVGHGEGHILPCLPMRQRERIPMWGGVSRRGGLKGRLSPLSGKAR